MSKIQEAKRLKPGKNRYLNYLHYLGMDGMTDSESLKTILENCRLFRKSLIFKEEFISSLKRNLKPPIHYLEDGIDIIYNKAQERLNKSKAEDKRKIKGVAGSGKTMVLAKRAVNAHIRTNNRVLILTYNLSLKNYIHDRISDVREKFEWDNFHIINYHSFFKAESNNHSISISSLADWQNIDHFISVKDKIIKYDAILIDEIQDFMQEWLRLIIDYFLEPDGELVVFGDEKQNIYERKMDEDKTPIIPTIRGAWNRSLNQVYRFTGDLIILMKAFQKDILSQKYDIDMVEELQQELPFDQTEIEYHQVDHIDPKLISNIIKDTLQENVISSSDACVLSTNVDTLREIDFQLRKTMGEKTTTTFETEEIVQDLLGKKEKIKTEETISSPFPSDIDRIDVKLSDISYEIESIRRHKKNHFHMKTGFLKLSTVHSFKGWDIPTLFLVVDDQTDLEKAELIYTGITRARYRLYIINTVNNAYHNCFSKNIKKQYHHFFFDEKIDKIKNDFFIEGNRQYKIGDKIEIISPKDNEKKKYVITKLKKYKVIIEDGYKFKFVIRQCGETNSSHRLRTGTKFLDEYYDKNKNKWISKYEKVASIRYFEYLNWGKDLYRLLYVNGLFLNSLNNDHFVSALSSELHNNTKISKGCKLISIGKYNLKDKNQTDLINILNILKDKPAVMKLADSNNEHIDFEIKKLEYDNKTIGLFIGDLNSKKPFSVIYLGDRKKVSISPVIYLRSVDNQEDLKFTLPRLEHEMINTS